MICAMRRQYSGDVKYCWPVSCWPAATSHRRNSAFSRPSGCRVMRPVTSACALMVFQLWNCGAWSMLEIFSMKAAWSIGANSPERFRLLVMTWVTPTPTSPSEGVPATKFGIAIGSGATLPSVICSRVCARAKDGSSRPAAAPPIKAWRRLNGKGGRRNDVTDILGLISGNTSAMKHLARIEGDNDVLPLRIGFIAQHVVGLPLQDGPHRGLGGGLIARRGAARHHFGSCRQPPVFGEPYPHFDHQFLGALGAGLHIPELRQARPHRVKLGLRQGRRGALRRA